MSPQSKGRELKEVQDSLGVTNEKICAEANVSMSSLRNVLNDVPNVRPRTKRRVLEALDRLKSRQQAG